MLMFCCLYVNKYQVQSELNLIIPAVGQVFDATNTTRERRTLILDFAKENSYKVRTTLMNGE